MLLLGCGTRSPGQARGKVLRGHTGGIWEFARYRISMVEAFWLALVTIHRFASGIHRQVSL